MQYGDEIVPEQPERDGYAFEGWEYPEGTPIESGKVFIGGELPEITELISKREMEVLRKLPEGKSRKRIADELFVTDAAIKKHSASTYSKPDVHNRTELIYKLTKQ